MKTIFIEAKDVEEAKEKAPWASELEKVIGGYMAFESIDDWVTWRKQA